MKQYGSIIYEDSDPWYLRHQVAIAVPTFALFFALLIMLPFFI